MELALLASCCDAPQHEAGRKPREWLKERRDVLGMGRPGPGVPLRARAAGRAQRDSGRLHRRRFRGRGPAGARPTAGDGATDAAQGREPLRLRRSGQGMTELTALTLTQARDGLRSRRFSAAELTDAHLGAIEQARALNAFVLETPEAARAMAQAADARLKAGEARPLEGIPLGIKDLFATRDVRTTACSLILDNFVPTYESTVTANLWRDGAVMLGKLNNDEFAMGSSNESSCFGPVVNPWRRRGSNVAALVPGGSSGGSAAAVAAKLCLGATATD